MSSNDNEQPLGQEFLANPYEFLQSYIRSMNNEIFLSEYQLNHLYSLLLLKGQAPWDRLQPNNEDIKGEIEEMVNAKIKEVKKMLESLSQIYEDKVKKNTFNQIERLMNIIKAKNKSILIEKDMKNIPQMQRILKEKLENQDLKKLPIEKEEIEMTKQQNRGQGVESEEDQGGNDNWTIERHKGTAQNQSEGQAETSEQKGEKKEVQAKQKETVEICTHGTDEKQVMTLFYGIANLPNLSSLALGNCLQYSSAERYIKFRMSKNYLMTIKNDDEQSFDRTSNLSKVPGDLFNHHIFPYLTAVQLFKVRGVCKEWMENVKESWHSTFKREMFIQLMACEFCKEIQHFYKLIQLRNPFFQKISLLMHALIEIIQWQKVYDSINDNTIIPQLKKVLIVILMLTGEVIEAENPNGITQEIWASNKQKVLQLKERIVSFFNHHNSAKLSINNLKKIQEKFLNDPFMRIEEINSQDKTPLLLCIFMKQMTIQQILKNHVYFSQQYLMNTKRRLDNISSKMPQQKGFLEGVYKILLLRGINSSQQKEEDDKSEIPNFHELLQSIFENSEVNKPDFCIKSKSGSTSIYLDKATKLDIIVSTVKRIHNTPDEEEMVKEIVSPIEIDTNSQSQNEKAKGHQIDASNGCNHPLPKKQLKAVKIYDINLSTEKKDFSQNTERVDLSAEDCPKQEKEERQERHQ